MATLKELAYKKATTPKGAIAVIDNAMAQTKDPAQIAALSQARQALTNPGQSPNETPSWFTKFIEPYVKSAQQQAQSQMGVSQAVGDNAAQAALAADAEYYGWSNNNPARQAGAVTPQIVIPNKPDPMSGDYWKVTTDANGVAKGEVDLLVATTVIEVGVDVPNASLMVIEHAERFGLSQLHQLRGRVGRGAEASVCLLLYQSPLGDTARQRLMTMRETTDGFEIARRDLDIRGPGEMLGARQAGVPMLRFADLTTDQWLVEQARQVADDLLAEKIPDSAAIIDAHLARWLGGKEDYLKV